MLQTNVLEYLEASAARVPDKVAFADKENSFTFSQLQRAAQGLGTALAELTPYQKKNFLNGPGKVCRALDLTRAQNGLDLTGDELFLWDAGEAPPADIHVGKRIGIDYAEEAVDFPWRFYL